jgi:hypothetical protein
MVIKKKSFTTMAEHNNKGWHFQSIRHSNARKLGRAGGTYLTAQDRNNIKNFSRLKKNYGLKYTKIIIPNKQRIRGVYDESTDTISLPHNSPDDLLAHEIGHAVDYYQTPPTKHDEQFYRIKEHIENQIKPLNNH